jgi:hypothetical protein
VANQELAPPRTRPCVSGYSGTPLAQKLSITAGCRLFLKCVPASYRQLLVPLPAQVQAGTRIAASTDIIHVFVTQRAALARTAKPAARP